MLTGNINFKNFKIKKNTKKVKKILKKLLQEDNEIIRSLRKSYRNSYHRKLVNKYSKALNYRIIGMGGSTLGAQTIYDFLSKKIKKKFSFIDNLQAFSKINNDEKIINLVISKSGNTIETIINTNLLLKKKHKNIFITENKKSYLYLLAEKLKADIVKHNNFIGGRYSVLSEVGMLPAELMGLKSNKFKNLNLLVKNKIFFNSLVSNVSSTLHFIKNKKYNSIIINYDEKSQNLFNWYQQLIAESLGKNKKGILPIISNMPKDNHSVMQLYLDGFKNNFYTFFFVNENNSTRIKTNFYKNKSFSYLKNKNLNQIKLSQKLATENVFQKKNIPFRSFTIFKRDEKTLGELFSFFILETILIGKMLNLNPYDQPAVELIKNETKKILI
ncbi:glucose-6-phosphate isomerase [Candidatus Pelagibacter communis]|uniref:glucose-6-phosphate isomerase n=1 Tax=Pelagibacter ubique TaxID=198252 RepID=UPI000AAA6D99|nr:glucose-6-phosphate isomerase [Candidatus Pelagibacter ubique]